jgi:hypothetical protein
MDGESSQGVSEESSTGVTICLDTISSHATFAHMPMRTQEKLAGMIADAAFFKDFHDMCAHSMSLVPKHCLQEVYEACRAAMEAGDMSESDAEVSQPVHGHMETPPAVNNVCSTEIKDSTRTVLKDTGGNVAAATKHLARYIDEETGSNVAQALLTQMIVNGELPTTARGDHSPAKASGASKVTFGSGNVTDGHGFFDRQIELAAEDLERTRNLEAKYMAEHEEAKAAAKATSTKEARNRHLEREATCAPAQRRTGWQPKNCNTRKRPPRRHARTPKGRQQRRHAATLRCETCNSKRKKPRPRLLLPR